MAKKKHENKIVPVIKAEPQEVNFSKLKAGECFLYNGDIWMKDDLNTQNAQNLKTGKVEEFLYEIYAMPVEITIYWKKK